MIALTTAGTLGILVAGPFIAVAVYYLFAVLRPQFIWEWALPPGIPWSQYVGGAAIVGGIAAALGLVPSAEAGNRLRRASVAHVMVVVFGLWVTVTYFTAQDRAVAGLWLPEYLKIFAMFVVATLVVTTGAQIFTLYLVITCALIYIAYEVNVLYLVDGRLDIYHHGYGGFDNNGAALMLAMGVPLSLYAWEAIGGLKRWLFAAAIPVLLHAVLMTYSRGAMLALLVAAPVVILRSRRRWQFSLAGVALACMIPLLAGPEIRDRFFTVYDAASDASANLRFDSWRAAIRIANDFPIVGVGIRNSNLLSYSYGADIEGRTIHSQYLQTLADAGYVGLGLYIAALAAVWVALVRSRRALKERTDTEAYRLRSIVSGIEGSLLVFCTGAAFLSLEVFELPYLLALLGCQIWVVTRASLPAAATSDAPDGVTHFASGALTGGRL